jgi:hypothetical protein
MILTKDQMRLKAALKQMLAALSVLALAGGPAMPQTASQLTRIGGAGAVRGSVNATAPNATVGRVVESGKPLYLNDHVTTKADSHLQVMLLDETVFTMGPDSDMVLDEFVYDPSTNAGKVTARLTKGAFRFVSGKVARQGPDRMNINTPTGTIGIRGTEGVIIVSPEGVIIILTGAGPNNTAGAPPGHIHVQNKFGSVEIIKVGFGTQMTINGVPTTPANMEKTLEKYGLILNSKGRVNVAPPAGAGGGGKVGAVQQTGSDFIAGLSGLQSVVTIDQQTNQSSLLTSQAQQDNSIGGTSGGLSSWDSIKGQLTSGTGYYSGSSVLACSGGGCGGPVTASLGIYINFGTKQIFTNSSDIQLSGGLTDSAVFPTTSFSSLHGPAVLSFNGTQMGNTSFTTTNILIYNTGGLAGLVQGIFAYSSTSTTAVTGGTVNAPKN